MFLAGVAGRVAGGRQDEEASDNIEQQKSPAGRERERERDDEEDKRTKRRRDASPTVCSGWLACVFSLRATRRGDDAVCRSPWVVVFIFISSFGADFKSGRANKQVDIYSIERRCSYNQQGQHFCTIIIIIIIYCYLY